MKKIRKKFIILVKWYRWQEYLNKEYLTASILEINRVIESTLRLCKCTDLCPRKINLDEKSDSFCRIENDDNVHFI